MTPFKTFITLAASILPTLAAAQFVLAPLPYPSAALEPHIDQPTMEIHHGSCHYKALPNIRIQAC